METMTQTVELMLPETGDTAIIKSYLTIGQSRELQRIIFQGSRFNPDSNKFDALPVETVFSMQDVAMKMLVTQVRKKDGTVIDFTPEWASNLPVKDGNLLYQKVSELVEAAQLTDESKKK